MLLSTESRSPTIVLLLISWLPSLYRGRLGTPLPLPRALCIHDLNPTAMYILSETKENCIKTLKPSFPDSLYKSEETFIRT